MHLIPLKAETSGGGGNTFQWNSFSNIEEINEGFLKTVTKGWNNNLAQSAGYQLSSEFCISIDLTRVDWGNGSLFKIGLDPSDIENIEEAELLMTFGDYKLSIPDGGEGIEADLGESSVLQLEYHSGILKIF
ncbi:MAG TPA: hypothetical protein DIU20_10500, partial [Cryomorphaceae bacterium]|nr:hypothetical protein [Cryomorphaceae bacterium]